MATLPKNATATRLAKILECSRKTVYGHIKKAGIKSNPQKEYPTRLFLLAVHKHRQEDNNKTPTIGTKAEKYRLECHLLEHKIKVLEGDYIHKDTAGKLWEKIVTDIRSRLLALPTKAAPLILGHRKLAGVKGVLDGLVFELLTELSAPITYVCAVEGGPVQTATTINSQPVGRRKQAIKPRVKRRTRAVANKQG